MDIGDISADEAGRFTHTLGPFFGNRLDEVQAEGCEAVDEVAVATELDNRFLVVGTLLTSLSILDELKRLFSELFSVADGDVERGHECVLWVVVSMVVPGRRQQRPSIRPRLPRTRGGVPLSLRRQHYRHRRLRCDVRDL